VEIDMDQLTANYRAVERAVTPVGMLPVVKAGAYGHGLVEVARLFESCGPAGLAVAFLEEGAVLRKAGIVCPILVMGGLDTTQISDFLHFNLTMTVSSVHAVGPIEEATRRLGTVARVHAKVDTGMGRVGIPYRRAAGLIADLAGRDGVDLTGTMTTLNEDPEFEKLQLQRFREVEETLAARGIAVGRRHAASSYGLFDNPPAYLDAVRPGMALFGQYSTQRFRELDLLDLRPSMSLKARVALVKKLEQGDTAGYEAAYRADRDVWIATVPAGHVDGVPRVAANGGWVRIRDTRYPIIASVSASHTIVEIGPEKTVDAGDVATCFDGRDGSRPEDASDASGASVYDLVMHLNPTLPRRLVS